MSPQLNIMYRTFDGFERGLAAQAAHFREAHPDVDIHLEHSGPEELYDQMVAKGGVLSGRWDIMLILTDWLPDLMKRGGLLRLNDYLTGQPPEDWPDGWSESMRGLQRDRAGDIFGMAYHDGPEMFHYRTDLFGSDREQMAFHKDVRVRSAGAQDLGPVSRRRTFLHAARRRSLGRGGGGQTRRPQQRLRLPDSPVEPGRPAAGRTAAAGLR